jgi:hypothetical protein
VSLSAARVDAVSGRVRGWLAVAVAVALAAALLVLASTPSPTGTSGPSDGLVAGRPAVGDTSTSDGGVSQASAVRDLLARRADAVLDHSEAEFMATLDPQADAAFVDAQRALFRNLIGVPLQHWSYQLNPDGALPLPAQLQGRVEEYWAPRTTLRYALAEVDPEPTSRPMAYLYVRRADRWFLASDTMLEPQGEHTWRGLWDFGPCTAMPVGSGVVIGHTGPDDGLLGAWAAELDVAVAAVSAVWGTDWSQRVAVLVPRTVDEMRALVGPAFNVDGIAAAAVADKVDVANHLAVGQRIVLNPAQAGRLSASARRIVLRHEITHIAARASTVDGAPLWLLEGFADYIGYRDSGLQPREAAPDLARAMRSGNPPLALPADEDFLGGTEHLDLAYQLAWSVALYVKERVGEEGLVRLYRQIAADRSQDQASVEDAIETVLGTDFNGFVTGWLGSLPGRFG